MAALSEMEFGSSCTVSQPLTSRSQLRANRRAVVEAWPSVCELIEQGDVPGALLRVQQDAAPPSLWNNLVQGVDLGDALLDFATEDFALALELLAHSSAKPCSPLKRSAMPNLMGKIELNNGADVALRHLCKHFSCFTATDVACVSKQLVSNLIDSGRQPSKATVQAVRSMRPATSEAVRILLSYFVSGRSWGQACALAKGETEAESALIRANGVSPSLAAFFAASFATKRVVHRPRLAKEVRIKREHLFALEGGGSPLRLFDVQSNRLPPMVIHDLESIRAAEKSFSRPVSEGPPVLVGCDQESRPTSGAAVSLLQLATANRAYVFDMLSLGATEEHVMLAADKLLCSWFASELVIKLGLGWRDDVKLLRRHYPKWRCFDHIVSTIDVVAVFKEEEPSVAQVGVSLSKLAAWSLKRHLSKEEQLSDWGHRPLTAQQLEYAALDAAVLVSIADKLGLLCDNKWKRYAKTNTSARSSSGACKLGMNYDQKSPP